MTARHFYEYYRRFFSIGGFNPYEADEERLCFLNLWKEIAVIWAPPLRKKKRRYSSRSAKRPKSKSEKARPIQKPLATPVGPSRKKPKMPVADFFLPMKTETFDLFVGGPRIGFRGDVYELVRGVPIESVRINGFLLPIKEEGKKLVAHISHFAIYEVEILTVGTATMGLRLHATYLNDNWPSY